MKERIKYLLPALLVLLPLGAGAQARQPERHSVELTWGPSVPTGSDFVDRTGWSSLALRWEYRIFPQLAAGLSAGFDRRGESGMTGDYFNGDFVTGYSERKATQIPLLAHVRYYPIAGLTHPLQPYIGLGAGVSWACFGITGETINTSRADSWAAAAEPEIGTRIYPVRGSRLWFDARLALRFAGHRWDAARIESPGHLLPSIGVGVNF